jgi:hypothetical protein
MRDERKVLAGVAVLVIAAAVFANLIDIQGEEDSDLSGFLVLAAVPLAIAALLFLRLIPRSRAQGNPPRAGIITSILGFLTVAVFWTNLPYVLGAAGIVLGSASRDQAPATGRSGLGTAAVVIGALAIVASLGVLIADEVS